jgi:hypothetical protein
MKENRIEVFSAFLDSIDNPEHRARTEEALTWVAEKFPELVPVVKWNQPMFTHQDTFIISFSVAKNHLAVSPEIAGMIKFADEIEKAGHDHSKMLIRFHFDKPIDYPLLEKMIKFNIEDKAGYPTFWRK